MLTIELSRQEQVFLEGTATRRVGLDVLLVVFLGNTMSKNYTNYTLEALIIAISIIIGSMAIDIDVTVNITDKPIINKLKTGGENRNMVLPTGKYN